MPAPFAVLYRWKVRPDLEHAFIDAWATATAAYRTIGALGSRLHRADDGDLYAYAEWPSRTAWENAHGQSPVDAVTAATMRDATLEFQMTPLDPIADLLARAN
ncbi:MAG TPA: antibiotic biosynthesis monooxygenase [Thermoanaerobaculia bacterium]|jgi:heme-degrading monooxygenase HmoA